MRAGPEPSRAATCGIPARMGATASPAGRDPHGRPCFPTSRGPGHRKGALAQTHCPVTHQRTWKKRNRTGSQRRGCSSTGCPGFHGHCRLPFSGFWVGWPGGPPGGGRECLFLAFPVGLCHWLRPSPRLGAWEAGGSSDCSVLCPSALGSRTPAPARALMLPLVHLRSVSWDTHLVRL